MLSNITATVVEETFIETDGLKFKKDNGKFFIVSGGITIPTDKINDKDKEIELKDDEFDVKDYRLVRTVIKDIEFDTEAELRKYLEKSVPVKKNYSDVIRGNTVAKPVKVTKIDKVKKFILDISGVKTNEAYYNTIVKESDINKLNIELPSDITEFLNHCKKFMHRESKSRQNKPEPELDSHCMYNGSNGVICKNMSCNRFHKNDSQQARAIVKEFNRLGTNVLDSYLLILSYGLMRNNETCPNAITNFVNILIYGTKKAALNYVLCFSDAGCGNYDECRYLHYPVEKLFAKRI